MDTNPLNEKPSRAQVFAELLRTAPPRLDRKWLNEHVLGKEGFKTDKDMSNAIIYAQKLGHLTTKDADGLMKNTVVKRAASASPKKAPGTSNGHSNGRSNGSGDQMKKALDLLDDTDALAARALLDPSSVKIEDLAKAVTSTTSVFHAVLDQ